MKFKNALFNVITIKSFIIQKSPLLSGMIFLNAGFLYCHAFDGDYVKLNIGDPGGNLPRYI